MVLNEYGEITKNCWMEIPQHFPNVELDVFVVMPNHIHGIIFIVGARHVVGARHIVGSRNFVGARHIVGARNAVPLQVVTEQFGKPVSGSISTIVRSLKSAVTKQINQIRQMPGAPVWQRNYCEHIVRDEMELNRIRKYIYENPINWGNDKNYR